MRPKLAVSPCPLSSLPRAAAAEVVDSGSDITLLFPGINGTDSSGTDSSAGWTPLALGTEEIDNYILPGKFGSVEDLLDAGTITSAAGSAVTFHKGSKGEGEGAVLAEFVINGTSRTYLVDPKPEDKVSQPCCGVLAFVD